MCLNKSSLNKILIENDLVLIAIILQQKEICLKKNSYIILPKICYLYINFVFFFSALYSKLVVKK